MVASADFTFALALAAGSLSLVVANHLRLPGIIVLLISGIGLGPDGLNWIDPKALGDSLSVIVGIAVAIILFEGGLHLDLRRLRRQANVIRNLVTIGALVSAVGGALCAYYIMGWDYRLSILFGTLVIVTGPTVVTPLLRRIGVKHKVATILEAEGVLIDPIGAIIAVVGLDIVLQSSPTEAVAVGLGALAAKLIGGFVLGLVGGFIIGFILKRERLLPEELSNIFALSLAIVLFEGSNALTHESGIMTVTIAGMVVGNMKIPMVRRLIDFKEQLTTMLIGLLFILLSADVRLEDMKALGKEGVLVVIAMMLIVRPINIWVSGWGSKLKKRERIFLSWLAPRGIVAAAVASLFAKDLDHAGISGGDELRALVFLVIAMTVFLQGLSAGALASLLKLRLLRNHGYVIAGANILGRTLAKFLMVRGEEVVLIDRNNLDCHIAKSEGLHVIPGNVLVEKNLAQANIAARRGVIGLTANEGVNLLLLKRTKELYKISELYIAHLCGTDISAKMIKDLNAYFLFAARFDYNLWAYRLQQDTAFICTFQLVGKQKFTTSSDVEHNQFGPSETSMVPLGIETNKVRRPAFAGMEIKKGDIILVALFKKERHRSFNWLREKGFELFEDDELPQQKNNMLIGDVPRMDKQL